MKYLIVLFAVVAYARGALFSHGSGALRIRFDIGFPWNKGTTFFYDIARHVSEVKELGLTKQLRADDYLPSLELYCPSSDFTFCTLYDTEEAGGFVAGVQIALDQEKFTDSLFDWEIQGFTHWQPVENGPTYWTTQQFFVNEAYMAIDAAERKSSVDTKRTLQTDGIWVRGINKELLKIATTEEGIENSIFTKQACIPWMGRHYYYNMSSTTECTAEGILPWFPLVNNGELIGTGLIVVGQLPVEDGKRDWFERPTKGAVQVIVPRGPECLYELADNPGLVTMHIYYVNNPEYILCI